MKLFEKLFDNSDTIIGIEKFLQDNMQEIYDFQNSHISEITKEKELIEKFIVQKGEMLNGLDYTQSYCKSFIIILFDFCERFGFQAVIRIENVIFHNKLQIGSRLDAARLYLLNVTNNSDLITRFDNILERLQYALKVEEDNERKIYVTFANYIAYVLQNAPQKFVIQLFDKIKIAKGNIQDAFFLSPFITSITSVNYQNANDAFNEIQTLIEDFLETYIPTQFSKTGFLIEENSSYLNLLNECPVDFEAIRTLSVQQFQLINDDSLFGSLRQGVAIIQDERQLYVYMNSYGPMHKNKLLSAFYFLPTGINKHKIEIIDWGCGQALATLTYLDYVKQNSINLNLSEVILIEPSELALRRGALHVRKFDTHVAIQTINKKLDDLTGEDINSNKRVFKLHLFSNILDMDVFSLKSLIDFIYDNFRGENYFVCVSPNIDDRRTGRLDAFEHGFKKNGDFKSFCSINNKSGEWFATKNWTRVLRVFKITI